MFDLIKRIFGDKAPRHAEQGSGRQAKDRLKLLLVHDRSALAPDVLPLLKDEIVAVISKYMEIDSQSMDISLAENKGSVALVASIPVVRWKRQAGSRFDR